MWDKGIPAVIYRPVHEQEQHTRQHDRDTLKKDVTVCHKKVCHPMPQYDINIL